MMIWITHPFFYCRFMKSRQSADDTDEEDDLADEEAQNSDLEDEKGFVFLGFDVDIGRRTKGKKDKSKKKTPTTTKPEPEAEKVVHSIFSPHLKTIQSNPYRDAFVRGLLCLDVGRVPEAVVAFLSLQSHTLVEFCVETPHLLFPDAEAQIGQPDGSLPKGNVGALFTSCSCFGISMATECLNGR